MTRRQNFALIGAAGYIAPRHMRAIAESGHQLVAALDPSDSVGVIDDYFPQARFFTEFERFDRHVYKLRLRGAPEQIDYVSICSPNYLHDAHIRFALRSGANAICEKPLVLNPWNIDPLAEMERSLGWRVFTILQLRLHPAMQALRRQYSEASNKVDIDLSYITSRGAWYAVSWKGDRQKSGGVATNIGVHFYDALGWIFGRCQRNVVHLHDANTAAGELEYERARVRWFLSVDPDDLPPSARDKQQRTYRSITIGGKEIDFSGGFDRLHTTAYQEILAGQGFGLEDARASIEIVHDIREATPRGLVGDYHPFAKRKR
ncbi:MAG: Gfo/Idh/MocA family oxidoreductase [Deltaproteobacteria bacterium]|nr:Gfo/Idh/MocA family oxidoreductase [Deltaproteobacteria bacterium]